MDNLPNHTDSSQSNRAFLLRDTGPGDTLSCLYHGDLYSDLWKSDLYFSPSASNGPNAKMAAGLIFFCLN